MTRFNRQILPVVVTVVETVDDGERMRPLEHLVHKSDRLDWTRSSGPGVGNAPSDLARSIVGDVIGDQAPAPYLYRKLTLRLARIPYEGGEITEDQVLEVLAS